MKTSEIKGFVHRTTTLVGMLIVALALAGSAAAQGTLDLQFQKAAVADTVWVGSVAGDVTGVLTTVLVSADTSAPVWLVDFYWIVSADDPERSFVARLTGTLDSETGVVSMSGHVVEGYRMGDSVEERGQMVDPERSAFEGTIVVTGS